MSDIAIRVENLGKLYRIGAARERHDTLRDALSAAFKRSNVATAERSHETFWALRDVSFEVKRGEVVGVIGRNGAGKSTLLKILSRITEPTTGRVELHGRVGSLLEVGTGFHPELTGRENIYLNGAILGMKKAEIARRFDEIVAFAEIEHFLDTPVKRYSSGMYVRLAFAVAAHLEPEILLVDEVLAVGDAAFQKKCLGKMGEVAGEGRTVIFVSHNMGAVSNLCSRAYWFDEGEVRRAGQPGDVIESYLRPAAGNVSEGSLVNRTDRSGNGLARYVSVRLLTPNGRESNRVNMGDGLTVEADFFALEPISRPVYGVFFKDATGNTILRGYSHESDQYSPIPAKSHGRFTCTFPRLPLMHGTYNLSLWLGRPGECLDFVEAAAALTIEASDVYGTAVLPDSRNGGVCFAPHSWTFTIEAQ